MNHYQLLNINPDDITEELKKAIDDLVGQMRNYPPRTIDNVKFEMQGYDQAFFNIFWDANSDDIFVEKATW